MISWWLQRTEEKHCRSAPKYTQPKSITNTVWAWSLFVNACISIKSLSSEHINVSFVQKIILVWRTHVRNKALIEGQASCHKSTCDAYNNACLDIFWFCVLFLPKQNQNWMHSIQTLFAFCSLSCFSCFCMSWIHRKGSWNVQSVMHFFISVKSIEKGNRLQILKLTFCRTKVSKFCCVFVILSIFFKYVYIIFSCLVWVILV